MMLRLLNQLNTSGDLLQPIKLLVGQERQNPSARFFVCKFCTIPLLALTLGLKHHRALQLQGLACLTYRGQRRPSLLLLDRLIQDLKRGVPEAITLREDINPKGLVVLVEGHAHNGRDVSLSVSAKSMMRNCETSRYVANRVARIHERFVDGFPLGMVADRAPPAHN